MSLHTYRSDVTYNKSLRLYSLLYGALGIFLPVLFILSFIVTSFSKQQLEELTGEGLARTLSVFTVRSDICTNAHQHVFTYYIVYIQSFSTAFHVFGACDYLFFFATGCSDAFMGLDTRRWTSSVCDHVHGMLLPAAFPGKAFCKVSVFSNMTQTYDLYLIQNDETQHLFINEDHTKICHDKASTNMQATIYELTI